MPETIICRVFFTSSINLIFVETDVVINSHLWKHIAQHTDIPRLDTTQHTHIVSTYRPFISSTSIIRPRIVVILLLKKNIFC